MIANKLNQLVESASPEKVRQAIALIFAPHANPVFGASKSVEHEVAAFNAMKLLGYLSDSPDEFELVVKLRITKSKARALLYQVALRVDSSAENEADELRAILTNPRIAVDGDFYLIEVPQPLAMDRLRHRVRQLGFLSDGSFSGSVARIKRAALAALVESIIPEADRTAVIEGLKRVGYQGADACSIISAMLKKAGMKVAGDIGEELVGNLGDSVSALLSQTWDRLRHA
jgi:hypothetical protein